MRFLHTADWHLGKRLHDFPLHEVQREAVGRIIELVGEEKPDAVVLAGDVFDTYIPQLSALELWEFAVDGIVGDLGVPMVVIPGNHDHPERLAVHSNLARRAGLHIIKGLRDALCPVVVEGVPIYGVPYHKPVHVNSAWREDEPAIADFDYQAAMTYVLERVRAHVDEGPAVLSAHAFVAGAGNEGEAEDPIQVGGAGAVGPNCFQGFSYVALGHIHGCRKVGDEAQVHYCGSPVKYSFDEAGHQKSVTMVEIDESGRATTERLPIEVSRDVRVIEGESFDAVISAAALVPEERRDDYLLVKVTDREPIDQALARLREWYPNSLLEQPSIEVRGRAPSLEGDYRTLSVEDAFEQFYRHVFGEEISGVERELMLETLHVAGNGDRYSGEGFDDEGAEELGAEGLGSEELGAESRDGDEAGAEESADEFGDEEFGESRQRSEDREPAEVLAWAERASDGDLSG
ncbi:MAG TPA: exonuclease SbcCD subunit D [Trueperaceae bacterium]